MELTEEKYRFLSGEIYNLRKGYEVDEWIEEALYVIVKVNVTEPINIGDNLDNLRNKIGWNNIQRIDNVLHDCVMYDIPFNDITGYVVVNVAYDLNVVTSMKLWS